MGEKHAALSRWVQRVVGGDFDDRKIHVFGRTKQRTHKGTAGDAPLVASTASAFAPAPIAHSDVSLRSSLAKEVDTFGNNVAVKELLQDIEASGLLTKVAESGLLSKAQEAGLTLTKLEPLLALAAENKEILILVEAASPELLPLLPKAVEVAPGALPLLANAVSIPPALLSVVGLGSLAAAAAAVVVVPDDTVFQVAEQTLAVGVLGAAGVAALVGSAVLGKVLN
eukprot:scaffold25800_cov162-Cylindrotheca_fusiformis.AAC.11